MDPRNIVLLIGLTLSLFLNCQLPAFANMPPGFMMSSAAGFLCLPVMIVLTFIAGGYSIFAQRRKSNKQSEGTAKGTENGVLAAFAWIGSAIVLLWCLVWACGVILLVVPIARSIDLVWLGFQKKRMGDQAPAYLAEANPTRLIYSGSVLAIVSLVAGTWSCWAIVNFPEPKQLQAIVKGNMRTCQLAAEDYAANHNGFYPESSKNPEFRSYYPGGSRGNKPWISGVAPKNPLTKLEEWPIDGKVRNLEDLRQTLSSKSKKIEGKYVVEYSAIFNERQQPVSYAVRGSSEDGTPIAGVGGYNLVLSNQ